MYVCVRAVWVCMRLPVCPLRVGVCVGGGPALIMPEPVSNPGLLSGLQLSLCQAGPAATPTEPQLTASLLLSLPFWTVSELQNFNNGLSWATRGAAEELERKHDSNRDAADL